MPKNTFSGLIIANTLRFIGRKPTGDYFKAAQDIEGLDEPLIGQRRMCGIHDVVMNATQRKGVKGFDTYYECPLCP
jgi:hypothetical protein|tara:strand:+ start:2052 stop:2279 length:228 start_codon:yes stop_codon:yes gene_type:complete